MRCNQVSISIERFGKYVPEDYPADVQRIHVYCDDFSSVYAALSKAYAMAVNELNEYEQIGVRTDLYTNEFSHMDYREMHGTIPIRRRKYEDDVDWQYYDTSLELYKDYIWVYEHGEELFEVIKKCREREDIALALKERFGLNDIQIRKLSQIRMDMLTKERYESAKEEIEKMEKEIKTHDRAEGWALYLRRNICKMKREIEKLEAYFVAADHYGEICKIMMEAEKPGDFMDLMKERFGFSDGQSRAFRYFSVNDFGREERGKKEKELRKLKEDMAREQRRLEEQEEKNKKV